MQSRRRFQLLAGAFLATVLLAGCGGGNSATGPRVPISRVVVAGDSLADVGVFGARFTVQNSADPAEGFPVFPQIVARSFGVNTQCNFFVGTSPTSFTTRPACSNFAVGGGHIDAASVGGNTPFSIPFQLATAAQANGGNWVGTDLLVVDGGGNDAADLVGAFLGAAGGSSTAIANYQLFLSHLIDAPTLAATLAQPNGGALAAGLYMQRLADTYYDAIKANALDRGAAHVAVLDMPDITLTPRFRNVLAGVTQTQGAPAAATLQATIRQWIDAFNNQLRGRIGGDARVAIVSFNADFTDQVTHPVDYGLANVTTPTCPVTGVNASGLPTFSVTTCTSTGLDATPPAGLPAGGWWTRWAFSDDFHPTPYGHQLLADSVNRALARAGWL